MSDIGLSPKSTLVYLPNPDSIPVEGADSRITCSDCPAICCRRGVVLPLRKKELDGLRKAGTDVEEYPGGNQSRLTEILARRVLYFLNSDCGNLTVDGKCGVWGTKEQPDACKQFVMGGYGCARARLECARRVGSKQIR